MSLPLSAATSVLDATMLHETRTSTVEKVAPTTRPHDGIRIVAPDEYKEAASCLAEAFRFDKIVRYAIDTPDHEHLSGEERFQLHKSCLEYVTYAHCLQGLVLAVGQNYDCVALWLHCCIVVVLRHLALPHLIVASRPLQLIVASHPPP